MLKPRRALLAFLLCQAIFLFAAGRAPARPAQADITGFWVLGRAHWVVQISPCGDGYCGRLVGLSKSAKPDAARVDDRNPDPARRARPLCGLPLLGGFTPAPSDPGTWRGGWIYDPDNGATYASRMWLAGPDTLKVRGYILVPWLGRNETLTRETGPANRCGAGAPPGLRG
ncbi:MAG: DUF2147 domain-containing protein [Geothrix sp.]|nr:DUF2147 domain-containing protein [Geothrix sp.]